MTAIRAVLVVVLVAGVAHADDTAAIAFHDAEELAKAGKWAEACPLYEASYRADTQLGALLHLADCHEHVGKLASAWAEFTDAIELAHARGDNREQLAKKRADTLAPRLAHLNVAAAADRPAGFVVKRDGVDITALLGSDRAIDAGEHEVVASAPGFVDWRSRVVIGPDAKTTRVDVPALSKVPEPTASTPEPAAPKPAALGIATRAEAQIFVDDKLVGTGHFDGEIAPGRHAVRVVAKGMLPYRNEIVVLDGEHRSVDVALEPEPTIVTAVPVAPRKPPPDSSEIALGFAAGQIGHADKPSAIGYRLDYGSLRSRHVSIGVFAEYGSIAADGSCGTSNAGAQPGSPFDFGPHQRFDRCSYVMVGFQVLVHILPGRRVDPFVAALPGGSFGIIKTTPYDALGEPMSGSKTSTLPGVVLGTRAGVDVRPLAHAPWAVGAFVELQYVPVVQDNLEGMPSSTASFVSWFGGLRTSYTY